MERVRRPAAYRFGACDVDLRARELRVHDAPRRLERKAFDLLVCLLERRDRIVSKRELRQLLWQGTSVCDGALTQCVWTARRAIEDAGRRDGWIRTFNGVGYRFMGIVEEAVPPEEHDWAAEVAFTKGQLVRALLRSPRAEDHALARLLACG